jgi:hypothetical protein
MPNFTFPNKTDRPFIDSPHEAWQPRPPSQLGTSVRQFVMTAFAMGYGVEDQSPDILAALGIPVSLFEGNLIWCVDDVSVVPLNFDGPFEVDVGVFSDNDRINDPDRFVDAEEMGTDPSDSLREKSIANGSFTWPAVAEEDTDRCFHGPIMARGLLTLAEETTEARVVVTVRAHVVGGHTERAYLSMQPELRALVEAGTFVMLGYDETWHDAALVDIFGA